MSTTLQPIYSQIVGAGGIASITFNNIPQQYSELVLKISSKRDGVGGGSGGIEIQFNSNATGYSWTRFYGAGTTSTGTGRVASATSGNIGEAGENSEAAWANTEVIIPNYSNGSFKTYQSDSVRENNGNNYIDMVSGLWQNTSPITSIKVFPTTTASSFIQNSTFSLYGLLGQKNAPKAIGGQITSDDKYWYHAFKTTGASTFIPNQDLSVEVLCVGGGGSGGTGYGAGGGGGGVVYGTTPVLKSGVSYSVTTGAGGAAQTVANSLGNNGGSSSFSSFLTALGGGGGGATSGTGRSGASGGGGGGGGNSATYPFGSGIYSQGFNGATATSSSGAGGGGAGGTPANPATTQGGAGGNGTAAFTNFGIATGTGVLVQTDSYTYHYYSAGAPGNGTGGLGNLGLGGPSISVDAPANTGAASSGDNTKAGGSGVVIVRYPL